MEAGLTPESAETPAFMYELAVVHARLGRSEEAGRWRERALALARKYGRQDLVATIERGLPGAR